MQAETIVEEDPNANLEEEEKVISNNLVKNLEIKGGIRYY